MEIRNDYIIFARKGMKAMSLTGCWNFNFTDIKKGLYLPIKNRCLDLSGLTNIEENYFMKETITSIVLPLHLENEINRLFKGTDYKSFFNIYYCGNYEQSIKLVKSFKIEELNSHERNIRVIAYGGDCKDNLAHAFDRNGYVKRWVWGRNAVPELLEERHIVNSILVPEGESYVYRYIDPETMIYRNIDSLIKGTQYINQICLHNEKYTLPKIERYLRYLNYMNYVYIEQGSKPGNEKAYLVNLDNGERYNLGKVNYIDKEDIGEGITIRTKDEKTMNRISFETLQGYINSHIELYHVLYEADVNN